MRANVWFKVTVPLKGWRGFRFRVEGAGLGVCRGLGLRVKDPKAQNPEPCE